MNPSHNIVLSGVLLETVWSQVQDLANALTVLTETALKDGALGKLRSAGTSNTYTEWSASGFTATSHALAFPVTSRRRGHGQATGWINFQVSLFGGGVPAQQEGNAGDLCPVLHVSYWHTPTDFGSEGMFVGFPAAWDDWEIREDRLLYWDARKSGDTAQWTFSLRLLDLDSEDTLRTSVIEPVAALLVDTPTATALPASLPGLLFYSNVDLGETGWDLVASSAPPGRASHPATQD
jgi:hypothetical protein